MARWTPEAFPIPKQGNNEKVREFIKKKYIDLVWIAKEVRRGPCVSKESGAARS